VDNKEQQVSEGHSVGGQIVARDYDDSPVPVTGRVLGQVDEEALEVAWGSEQDAGYPRGTYEPVDGLRPIRSCHKEVCIMPNRRGAARPGPDPLADRYVVANIATLAALDNTPGSEQDRHICAALARRGLVHEQDRGLYLTDAVSAALAAWDARQDGPGAR
jgi:hypothetical protein